MTFYTRNVLRNTSPPFFKEGMPDEANAEYGWGGPLASVIGRNEAASRNTCNNMDNISIHKFIRSEVYVFQSEIIQEVTFNYKGNV